MVHWKKLYYSLFVTIKVKIKNNVQRNLHCRLTVVSKWGNKMLRIVANSFTSTNDKKIC